LLSPLSAMEAGRVCDGFPKKKSKMYEQASTAAGEVVASVRLEMWQEQRQALPARVYTVQLAATVEPDIAEGAAAPQGPQPSPKALGQIRQDEDVPAGRHGEQEKQSHFCGFVHRGCGVR